MVAVETEKRQFLNYYSIGCYEGKKLPQNLNLIDSNHHCKYLVDWITVGSNNCDNLKNVNFWKKRTKVKNII